MNQSGKIEVWIFTCRQASSFSIQTWWSAFIIFSARMCSLRIWSSNHATNVIEKDVGFTRRCIQQSGGRKRRYDSYGKNGTCQTLTSCQITLPVRTTLIPVLITSDQTCLTNFSSYKKLWPIFMSL